METTILEADNIDLDVVWWSDHDGNYTHHHSTTVFGFESTSEPRYQGEAWIPTQANELNQVKVIQPLEESDDVMGALVSLR